MKKTPIDPCVTIISLIESLEPGQSVVYRTDSSGWIARHRKMIPLKKWFDKAIPSGLYEFKQRKVSTGLYEYIARRRMVREGGEY